MAYSYHHALSSARRWGGAAEDYLAVHDFLDVIWTVKNSLTGSNRTTSSGASRLALERPEKVLPATDHKSATKAGLNSGVLHPTFPFGS